MSAAPRGVRPLAALRFLLPFCATLACASARAGGPVTTAAGPRLLRAVAAADSLVTAAVGRQVPGAVFLVAKDGLVLHARAYGVAQRTDYEGQPLAAPRPMAANTLFDVASLTKVMATTFAVMLLADRGQLDVDAPVYRYLPDFRGPHLDSITVRHLLNHSSGLIQWQPLYYQASNAAEAYAAIRAMPLGWGVGEGRHYSDLGFMLLGYIVERVGGRPLDAFVDEEIYQPLGLRRTAFLPKERGFTNIAATEQGNVYERHMVYDSTFGYRYRGDPAAWDRWRRYVLVGEVDDGNAFYAHGGVAGHAGLFSTAADLRVLLDLLNGRGTYQGRRVVSAAVVNHFLTRDDYGHYLGWMMPRDMPDGSFAHTGFTGTWALGVPRYGLSVVLLTNRQNMGTDARGYFPDLAPLQHTLSQLIVRAAAADAGAAASARRR